MPAEKANDHLTFSRLAAAALKPGVGWKRQLLTLRPQPFQSPERMANRSGWAHLGGSGGGGAAAMGVFGGGAR